MADEDLDTTMVDDDAVQEEHMMYGHGAMTEQDLNEKYPNRPHNHSKTLLFSELYLTLFNPLGENKKKPSGPPTARRKQGPHGPLNSSPNEVRKQIIQRFISRWREQVGNDIFPAFRLIVPEKDRDRAMYGLKESTLGKLLVRVMKIDKNSEDGYNLLHWKLPGIKNTSAMAGDFAGRCFEVISKRPMRTTPGELTIAQVNELLDRLSVAQKEENQLPIIETFYERMNAEEMLWLIRMILRQMKIGATEKTILELWHPDAEQLFNISSSLRRVCWELYDPDVRLEGDNKGIHLMNCFQPQLAAFQMRSMEQMVTRMRLTEEDPEFWIEEKLDGERMQLHMVEDDTVPGGKRFGFWSRKAKDYTYLYGNGFEDDNAALTRHLKNAFHEGVRNIILDGEMITWDPKQDAIVPFGTLKTAALSEQTNPFSTGNRPFFKVFDCLYLNDVVLTQYTLRDRHKALEQSVRNVNRRLEVHEYRCAKTAAEIEPLLREVVAEKSEGLVLKNPRSEYRLNERNDDWIKVKPEYMTEFGEALDCVVIGGYYGSGKRGGGLSSFMCGLRVDKVQVEKGDNPQKCFSFFKVGGGFSASDYAEIRHHTEGKWIDWDSKKPPSNWIYLGNNRQCETPDVWIKPEDSVVLEVKAASVNTTTDYAMEITLRFPRFKKLRLDKTWKEALTISEFKELKESAESEKKEKQFKVDDARRKRTKRQKREIIINGQEEIAAPYAGPSTKVFEGLSFFVMSDALKPLKKTIAEIKQLVNANGGKVVASDEVSDTILIADRPVIKVASVMKRDQRNIIRPSWLYDSVKQSEVDVGRPGLMLPLEPKYLLHTASSETGSFDGNVDEYGDSYTKDFSPNELLALFNSMKSDLGARNKSPGLLTELEEESMATIPGWMFQGLIAFFVHTPADVERFFQFGGGEVSASLDSPHVTHVVIDQGDEKTIRKRLSKKQRLPRIVRSEWVTSSWREKTRLDEERYALI